ncbi:MAG: heavy metal translocating P-type ATPase [bacterium]
MSKTKEIDLRIKGMHCAGCAANIEKGMAGVDGIEECRVNFALHSSAVVFDSDKVTENQIIDKIKELGYQAEVGTPDILVSNLKEVVNARQKFMLSLLLSIPILIFHFWHQFLEGHLIDPLWDSIIPAVFATIVLFISGSQIISDAFKQALRFRANMNTLISMGTLTAYLWSLAALYKNIFRDGQEDIFFESVGMIITLILLGRYLEAISKGKAGEAIQALIKLKPSKTTAVINLVEIEIETATVKKGMILIVRPGEKIPTDGEIIEGTPVIDESMLTGESLPIEKNKNDKVFGGSINGNVPFRMKVTTTSDESLLAHIIKLVTEAQSKKAPVQSLADKVAGVFVPIVISLAVVTYIVWNIFDPESPMMIRSVISVLIIACPCALGLATPTAILAGTGRAAKEGIIIRGGDILEKITKITAVIFDKTGTLTHGELEVVNVLVTGKISERKLTQLAGSAEIQSEHPIGRAIVRHMKQKEMELAVIKNVEAFPGFGLTGEFNMNTLIIGNRQIMEQKKILFGQSVIKAEQEMKKGRSVVFIAVNGHVEGIISVSDRLRSEAKDVIQTLKKTMHVGMISGDNRQTAEGIARSAGLEHFEAEIKPEQKEVIIDSFRRAGYVTAMVGDGINDAPALAAADVGISIGSGTDVAIESSDVVLIRSNLNSIIDMFTISKATMKVIKRNLFWAFFYNIAAIPIAAGVFYPWFGISFSPAIAAAAMAMSSIMVVTNSLRLNYKAL